MSKVRGWRPLARGGPPHLFEFVSSSSDGYSRVRSLCGLEMEMAGAWAAVEGWPHLFDDCQNCVRIFLARDDLRKWGDEVTAHFRPDP